MLVTTTVLQKNKLTQFIDNLPHNIQLLKAVSLTNYSRISLVRTPIVRSHVIVCRLCPVPNYTNDKPLSGEIF